MTKTYTRRMAMVFLWLLLSVNSIEWWKRLSALKPEDPPFYRYYDYTSYFLGGSWYLFASVSAGLTALYILELINHKPAQLRQILTWVAIMGLSAAAVFPIGSNDIFGYAASSHLHAHYGLNPHLAVVADISDYLSDPFLKNMHWIKSGSPYGPLWSWLAFVLDRALAGFGLIPLLFGFKFLGLFFHLLITRVIYKFAELISAGRGAQAALLYGTNPLIIFEHVSSAHNDGPAILLLLFSLYLLYSERRLAGFFTAGIAAALKMSAGLAIPFIIWKTRKEKGFIYANMGAFIIAAVVITAYLTFWNGENPFRLLHSPVGFISNSLSSLPYALGYKEMIRPVHIAGVLVFFLWYAWLLWGINFGKGNEVILAVGLGYIAFFLFGGIMVHRWYYIWPLAIMAPLPDNHWTKVVIGQTMLLLLSYSLMLVYGDGEASNSLTYLIAWAPLLTLAIFRYPNLTKYLPANFGSFIKKRNPCNDGKQ